jgi:hypothetical protein
MLAIRGLEADLSAAEEAERSEGGRLRKPLCDE